MVEQQCNNKKCKHKWDYKGVQKHYCTCPKCLHKVKIKNEKKKEEIKTREWGKKKWEKKKRNQKDQQWK